MEIVPSEMVLFAIQEWKFEILLSLIAISISLALLSGCILLALISILPSSCIDCILLLLKLLLRLYMRD